MKFYKLYELHKLYNYTVMAKPWADKYRPQTINEILIPDNVKIMFNHYIETGDIPNLLLHGSPGVGKTSSILVLAKQIMGEHFDKYILEINASDDRGVELNNHLHNFCKRRHDPRLVKYKLIILDEADSLTEKVQKSIDLIMDQYQHTTKFSFACNNANEIIEAIHSRCVILEYPKLSKSIVVERLENICVRENVPFTPGCLETIYEICDGDMRNAINKLQLIANTFEQIREEDIQKLNDKPCSRSIRRLINLCDKKICNEALQSAIFLRTDGFSVVDILLSIRSYLEHDICEEIITKRKRIEYLRIVNEFIVSSCKDFDSKIQLTACIIKLIRIN